MLPLIHATIGTLVIVTNAIAAVWLWLCDRWEQPLVFGPRWALWVARGTLALQVALGLALIGSGAVGRTGHYLFALIAVVSSWYAFTTSRRNTHPLRVLALGCAASALCAFGAYLLGRA